MGTETWVKVGVVAALFVGVFWMNLRRLWLKTAPFIGEANWGHSIFVPIVGLYYLFANRETLRAAGVREFVWGPVTRFSRLGVAIILAGVGGGMMGGAHFVAGTPHTIAAGLGEAVVGLGVLVLAVDWSLALMLAGLYVFAFGYVRAHNDFITDAGMVITLGGVVLMLSGPAVMRTAWFPVAFLFCALPWPGLVYSWVAEPLQQMAAVVAVEVLKLTGVDAVTSGTKIVIASGVANVQPRVLNVAEACAGMRSLMTFISVAAALAFLSVRPLWQRLIMVASAVPIAIGCNVARISGQGLLDHYASPKWSESFAHQMVGLVMLIPAFLLILLVGWVLDQLFIVEADDPAAEAERKAAAPPKVVVRASPAVKAAVVTRAAAPTVVVKPATPAAAPAVREPVAAKPAQSTMPPTIRLVPAKPAMTTPPRPRSFTTPVTPVPSSAVPSRPTEKP